jgi:tetratricopeptide (TPR) repeat protein
MGSDHLFEKPEDNEEDGRTLPENEFIKALTDRDDIFRTENSIALGIIEFVVITAGLILGIYLYSRPIVPTSPDFYKKVFEKRTAKLLREQVRAPIGGLAKPRVKSIKYSAKNLGASSALIHAVAPRPVISNQRERTMVLAVDRQDTDLISQATIYKKRENYAKAIRTFRRVLGKDPRNAQALSGLGDSYLYAGLLDSSAGDYKAALAADPRNVSARIGLGSVFYFNASSPSFTNATRAYKTSAAFMKSQYDSAMAEYDRALSLDSFQVQAFVNRGLVREVLHDTEKAIEDYTKAIKNKPSYADAYIKRAATYKSLGKFKQALADYTAAIERDSGSYLFDPTLHFSNAYFGRGNVYYQTGEFEKAVADYDSSLKLSPNNSLAFLNRGRALGDAQQYDSAIASYTRAITLLSPREYNGAQEHAYFGRGLVYNLTRQFDKAIIDFNKAIQMNPIDFYAYFQRGNAEKALNKLDDAKADYTTALRFQKLAAKSCWRIAECYALEKDRGHALEWLKKAIAHGFGDFGVWKNDKDFSILWDDKEFVKITDTSP